jgi:exopolysaccharide production protein ExoQ
LHPEIAIPSRGVSVRREQVLDLMARSAFLVYLFFIFFGTEPPFDASLRDQVVPTSNSLNQSLSLLFLVSFISLWGKMRQVVEVLLQEKFLALFLGWMAVSITWSDYPLVTLKRSVAVLGESIICLAFLLRVRWSSDALRYFRLVAGIYIVLTIASVIIYPRGAIQWEFPAWRGLAPTKNNLGQISLFSIVIWLSVVAFNKGRLQNALHYVLLALSVVALLGARSTTSFLVAAFLLTVAVLLRLGTLSGSRAAAIVYTTFVAITCVAIALLVFVFTPDFLSALFGVFGKDMTFTGRVDLWEAVLAMTKDRMWLGWGFGAFWVMDSPHLTQLFQQFIWIPNQAHQGYLDVFNQNGLIGITLLFGVIVSYFRGITRARTRQVWLWIVIAILVFNLQESLFFRPRHIGHFLFVFSYLALHTDLLREGGLRRLNSGPTYSHREVPLTVET